MHPRYFSINWEGGTAFWYSSSRPPAWTILTDISLDNCKLVSNDMEAPPGSLFLLGSVSLEAASWSFFLLDSLLMHRPSPSNWKTSLFSIAGNQMLLNPIASSQSVGRKWWHYIGKFFLSFMAGSSNIIFSDRRQWWNQCLAKHDMGEGTASSYVLLENPLSSWKWKTKWALNKGW